MINTHRSGVVEDNSFGTHEYFELCRQFGCDTLPRQFNLLFLQRLKKWYLPQLTINNTLLGSFITTDISIVDSKRRPSDEGNLKLPQLIKSASVDKNGVIHSTIVYTSATKSAKVKCQIADTKINSIKAEILTGDIHDKNDFDNSDVVKTIEFSDFRKLKDGFTTILPPCSIVKFAIE